MAQSQAFYGGLLGWEAVSPTGSVAGPRFYANHEQYVELLPPPVEGQSHRMDRVAFTTDDAEGLRKALARKGDGGAGVGHVGARRKPQLPRA